MDDLGHDGRGWPTLSEAAARSGYTREALRLRARRGKLKVLKDNTGQIRVDPRALADLPPPDTTLDDHGQPGDGSESLTPDDLRATLDVLRSTLDDLRVNLGQARSDLAQAQSDRLVDRGRAERAEAEAAIEKGRREAAEAAIAVERERREKAEADLEKARTPWLLRTIRELRKVRPAAAQALPAEADPR